MAERGGWSRSPETSRQQGGPHARPVLRAASGPSFEPGCEWLQQLLWGSSKRAPVLGDQRHQSIIPAWAIRATGRTTIPAQGCWAPQQQRAARLSANPGKWVAAPGGVCVFEWRTIRTGGLTGVGPALTTPDSAATSQAPLPQRHSWGRPLKKSLGTIRSWQLVVK